MSRLKSLTAAEWLEECPLFAAAGMCLAETQEGICGSNTRQKHTPGNNDSHLNKRKTCTISKYRIRDNRYNYCFDFMSDENVIIVVPSSYHGYLNYDIMEFFNGRALFNMSLRLYEKKGIKYLGEFIKLKAIDLLPYVCNNWSHIERLEAKLAEVNLRLGSIAPGWQPPSESFYMLADPNDPGLYL